MLADMENTQARAGAVPPDYLTTSEAAALLGVHPATIYKLVRSGALRHFRLRAGRSTGAKPRLRFRREDIDAYMGRNITEARQ